MSDAQVARVYATALFAAATDAGTLEQTSADLHAFATALAESRALADVISDPQIDRAARRRVLAELTRDGDELAANALKVLLEKGRIVVLPEVVTEFDRMAAEAAGLVELELTTAVPVAADVAERVVARVEQATGRRARLTSRVEPAVIGGLVLRVGEVIVDGSLRSRIRQLRKRMELADVRGGG